MSIHVLSWLTLSVPVLLLWPVCGSGTEVTPLETCVYLITPQYSDELGTYQDGDVIIGGLINLHNLAATPDLSFTRKPGLAQCLDLTAAMSMISGGNKTCGPTKPAKLLIGDSSSTQSILLSTTLVPLKIPMLLQHVKDVHYTTQLGEEFYFLEGGIPPVYDLVNWQIAPDGSLQYAFIGHVDGNQLSINDSAITWPGDSGKVPISVCTSECPPGTRKAIKKGLPVCCFDCLPCTEGEISNSTGSIKCYRCPKEFWSNSYKNECVARETEFLSVKETMGITLMSVAVSGAVMTTTVAVIFLYHRNTPIVKANNSELSFLLLLSLKLCFLCALVFVGQPSLWSCRIQQAAFGISFVLCISCILVKTFVVLIAFHSTRPESSALIKWFGLGKQRGIVLVFTCVQVVICAIWLCVSPPLPYQNFGMHRSKVILECTIGSVVGFTCVLGYIGFLATVCFLLAFFARKLPDNFNEAKFITFSMLIFCAVWVAFVPAYVSSPGKYSVVVEVFAILASSFGLLFCIFVPKCYIILLKPENNTKKFLMGKE
ncbi:olfactory receptor CR1 isoform 1 precursor [Danio rerio]|uniref:Novel phermone receptor n=1 Tax=Danio rerio TaxID=7955 RepID=B0S551_DANRE|nr:olfactory receptor CR1 precursor [Danio rerio]CAQ13263.1 novel phermone receptor [Danio rerio]|eukprot:NP_001121719.1 si:ch211-203b20.7 precursor [Danio rerio]